MTLLDRMGEAMRGMFDRVVYVYPVREEEYTEPRYQHWWQGWLEPRRVGLVDDEGESAGHIWRWRGPRREVEELNTRRREVEEPLPVRAEVEANLSNGLRVVGDIRWTALPRGVYHKVRVKDASGVLLFEVSLSRRCIEDNDTLTVDDLTVNLVTS